MPPQRGIAPRIRIGRRWYNTLWALPIGAAALLCLIALAQSLRELAAVAAFIEHHPGIAQSAPSVDSGFPWWLQLQHFLNMLFMLFIMRAGLQILADHPRLYWGRDCTPGSDWFRFQVPVPEGRLWTAKDDSVYCGAHIDAVTRSVGQPDGDVAQQRDVPDALDAVGRIRLDTDAIDAGQRDPARPRVELRHRRTIGDPERADGEGAGSTASGEIVMVAHAAKLLSDTQVNLVVVCDPDGTMAMMAKRGFVHIPSSTSTPNRWESSMHEMHAGPFDGRRI